MKHDVSDRVQQHVDCTCSRLGGSPWLYLCIEVFSKSVLIIIISV